MKISPQKLRAIIRQTLISEAKKFESDHKKCKDLHPKYEFQQNECHLRDLAYHIRDMITDIYVVADEVPLVKRWSSTPGLTINLINNPGPDEPGGYELHIQDNPGRGGTRGFGGEIKLTKFSRTVPSKVVYSAKTGRGQDYYMGTTQEERDEHYNKILDLLDNIFIADAEGRSNLLPGAQKQPKKKSSGGNWDWSKSPYAWMVKK